MDSNTRKALEIFSLLINDEKINNLSNKELYRDYLLNTGVQDELEEITNIFDINLYRHDTEGLFCVAGVNNRVFGYTNEELRRILKLKSNAELYLGYFIMYNIITFFYIQSNYRTHVNYIKPMQVYNKVDEKLNSIIGRQEKVENEESFIALKNTWKKFGDFVGVAKDIFNEDEKRGDSKLAFVNKILSFMVDNHLLSKNEDIKAYMITAKLEALVQNYFEERDVKNVLTDILEEEIEKLERNEDNAEY